jgi:hypothetical protein
MSELFNLVENIGVSWDSSTSLFTITFPEILDFPITEYSRSPVVGVSGGYAYKTILKGTVTDDHTTIYVGIREPAGAGSLLLRWFAYGSDFTADGSTPDIFYADQWTFQTYCELLAITLFDDGRFYFRPMIQSHIIPTFALYRKNLPAQFHYENHTTYGTLRFLWENSACAYRSGGSWSAVGGTGLLSLSVNVPVSTSTNHIWLKSYAGYAYNALELSSETGAPSGGSDGDKAIGIGFISTDANGKLTAIYGPFVVPPATFPPGITGTRSAFPLTFVNGKVL